MDRRRLEKMFLEHGVDALISEAPQTRLWYSGIETTDGFIVIEKNKATLFVDGRYIEYATKFAKNVDIILIQGNSMKKWFEERKFSKIALEEDYLIKQVQDRIISLVKPKEIVWVNAQELRIVKSKEELKIMQKVVDISLSALEEFKQWVKPGVSEKDAAAMLNFLLKKHGGDKEGFDEIIASAASSAEPHHHPTDKLIEDNNLLKVDFGAKYKGYTADITRTFFIGDEAKANPKAKEILQIVKEAAALGRKAVRPGVKTSDIDRICRDYIASKGYAEYFTHSTGHGLGIDVHELPSVSSRAETVLEPGMIITVEPGIYIEGLGGARIEDDVLVTENGYYVFSRPDETNEKPF
ncbi:aminopeptidase P family protein [Mycoplasmopsis edwardii]|uniref:Aminopeptidase P family protein n=1 Tax=Mycoplasmopsis edwardii TaxID=53558 RepID=A0ACD4PIV2_9BACT|nr:aminopeptidase P family protein [Mycoplasmopsis edwardii]WBP83963.1 aminopeptidase P family protein [Mycoplasmopsis edwardii]